MKKIRVLHIANQMNLGGVERWLLGICEELQDSNVAIDIIVHTKERGVLDPKFKALGVNLIPCLGYKNAFNYIFNLVKILKKGPPYQVVHSHVLYFSGVALFAAWLANVPIRISHAHSNRTDIEPKKGIRALYISLMKRLIKLFATDYIAVSQEAHKSVHTGIVTPDKLGILYCGIKHLNTIEINHTLRTSLHIDKNTLVLGHVGRMSEPKNHQFLLQIMHELKRRIAVKLLLVGDGELRSDINDKINELDLHDDVILLGSRDDAVNIMASVFDIIAFPSLYEGLPLTVVEAQAVGVPILIADNITKEAEFDQSLVSYLPLTNTAKQWADKIQDMASLHQHCRTNAINPKFQQTDFYLPNHIKNLMRLYKPHD